jgi:WD40 repeat protein
VLTNRPRTRDTASTVTIVTLLGGRYQLQGLLGRGGMGEVYRAVDTASGQDVAVKILPADAGRQHADRLRREASVVSQLDDPHIVAVLDSGSDDGRLYVAMRLVEGADLRRVLAGGPLTPARTVRILTRVAMALDAAHAGGVVHRDVKPANILIDEDGDAYLTDFGIARPLDPEATRMTVTGGYVGSLDYIAPEQLRGLDVTGTADVYSLACVLYECLSGRVPFPGADPAAKLAAQLNSVPPAPSVFNPHVPPTLDLVVATGMDKDPRRRFATAGQLMTAVEATLVADRPAPVLAGHPDLPGQQVIMRAIVSRRRSDPPRAAGDLCPYPGLRSFGAGDAAWFHGRDTEITDLLVRLSGQLQTGGPLVVVGASGTGKSSLLVAGLFPVLDKASDATWPRVVLTPGDRPVETLAARLAGVIHVDPGTLTTTIRQQPARFGELCGVAAERAAGDGARPVIVVDQFEQLFTDGADPRERTAFATALAHAWPALVILSMRADYVPDCIALEPLRGALDSPFVVSPLGVAQLREVITLPAEQAGLVVEDGLVDRLINDVGARDGVAENPLPRLAHALRATWQNRVGNVLTLRGYQATGGVDRAVAVTADQLYSRLHPHHQAALRAALLRLVRVLPDGGLARRRAARGELDEGALASLVDARLVSVDDEGVRLSHDALLVAWPRLRMWVDLERADLLLRQRLDEAVGNWVDGGRERGDLYRGTRLAAALEWAGGHLLTPPQRDFLRASEREQRRTTRRLRGVIAALAVLLVASLAASVVAYYQTGSADEQLGEAESRRLATLAEQNTDIWPRQSQLLAAAAWQRARTKQARDALLATENQPFDTILSGHEGVVQTVEFSQDGKTLVSGGMDGTVRLWDVERRSGKVFFTSDEEINVVTFSPSGDELAVGSSDDTLYLLDARTAEVRQRIRPGGPVLAAAYSPDGRTIATSHAIPQLWSTATGQRIGQAFVGHEKVVTSVLFTEDGQTLVSSAMDGTIRSWRVADQTLVRTIATGDTACQFVAYDPLAGDVACRTEVARIGRWDLATGEQVGEPMEGHTNAVQDLAYGYEGRVLASTSADRTVRLWYLATGQQIGEKMQASDDDTFGIVFSPDSRMLAVASADGGIALWRPVLPVAAGRVGYGDISKDGRLTAFSSNEEGLVTVWDVASHEPANRRPLTCPEAGAPVFSPDGTHIAAPCAEGLRIWTVTGTVIANIGNLNATVVAYHPDGETIAVSAQRGGDLSGGKVMVVHLGESGQSSQVLWTGEENDDTVLSLAFSQDGTRLAGGTIDGALRLWDLGSGDQIGEPLTGHHDGIQDIAFQPHGNLLATAGWDNTIRLWDLTKHEPADAPLTGHTDRPITLSFSPNGTRLASAGWDGTPLVWDVASRTVHATLRGQDRIQRLEFADGENLVGTGGNGLIATWRLDPRYAREDLCRRLAPQLTPEEWRRFAADVDYVAQCG